MLERSDAIQGVMPVSASTLKASDAISSSVIFTLLPLTTEARLTG